MSAPKSNSAQNELLPPMPVLTRQFGTHKINYALEQIENIQKMGEILIAGIPAKDITIYPICRWTNMLTSITSIYWVKQGSEDSFGEELDMENPKHQLLNTLLDMEK